MSIVECEGVKQNCGTIYNSKLYKYSKEVIINDDKGFD